jgi:antitoxin component YwqK of YwqJK toxin-antitoxin module
MKIIIAFFVLTFTLFSSNVFSQISIREYKQAEEQTFYITTDSNTQKFNAKTLKKPLKPSPLLYYTWYKYNQVFTTQGGYDGRILNGEYTSSFKSNSLKMKGHYNNGLKSGQWYEWGPDGKLKEVSNWKNGMRNKISTTYISGAVSRDDHYQNNLLNGKSIKYENAKMVVETLQERGNKTVS